MTELTFECPLYPSLNEQERAGSFPSLSMRRRLGAKASRRRAYQSKVRLCVLHALHGQPAPNWARATVEIDLWFPRKRTRDLDKWTGAAWWLVDALKGLLIADDSSECIGQPVVRIARTDAPYRAAVVTVRRIE